MATVVGLWVCACSSDASYGGTSGPFNAGGSGVIIPPPTTAGGKGGFTKGGAGAIGIIAEICPQIRGGSGPVINVGQGGGAFGATTGAGATTQTGGVGGESSAGAAASGGASFDTGGAASDAGGNGGLGAGGDDGTLVPCPSVPPIEQDQQACAGPGICPYVDGTTCRCEACDEGWCWNCNVAQVPFGCPRVPPRDGESCPWTGVICSYGDCNLWDNTVAGCCLGEWKVAVDHCAQK